MTINFKLPMKKAVVSTMVAASLFTLPALTHPHKSFAANVSISTTHELLNTGDVNSDVKSLQTELRSLNYYQDTLDGIYGPNTANAVRNYQRDHGLKVDGIAGPNTLGSIFSRTSPATTRTQTQSKSTTRTQSTATISSILLKVGSHGAAVQSVQAQLKNLGYLKGAVDGIFGPVTKSAVMSFQRAQGLSVDGIVGPNTQSALTNAASSSTAAPATVSSRSTASTTPVAAIVKEALSLRGVPYQWGGESPSGFDCSGFVQYVFEKNGVTIPRTTGSQWADGTSISTPQVGDLVFFHTYRSTASHVGIYIGNNKFVDASSSHGVTISSMDNSYWKSRYLGAKRY